MTEQEITQARSDVDQLDIEQLRCGVLLQLLHIEQLTKQRDELRLQIDIQAGSIEAVQAANQRLAGEREALMTEKNELGNIYLRVCETMDKTLEERDALAALHKECVKCLGEALQDRADLAAAAKLALEALVDCAEWDAADDPQRPATEAITALRQAGVQ